MKIIYGTIALILSFIFTFGFSWEERTTGVLVQEEIANEVLRFHVRANSDKKEDQKVKHQVKKAVVDGLQPFMEEVDSKDEALLMVENHLSEMRQAIQEELNENECTYGFQISIDKEHFPEIRYGDCTFPAGVYEAVVISLGEGKGHNWWCMIYPGLCFLNETYAVVSDEKKEELKLVLTEDAYDWVTESEHVKVKFRIEWLNRLFQLE